MAPCKGDQSDTKEESGNDRLCQDAEWLSTLSEPELDFLVSLKELATRRAKNVGYKEHDNKFDLRMLRTLGFILFEYFKERVKSTSEIPDSADMLRLLSECGLSTLDSGESSDKPSDGGAHDLGFLTPRRKRMWDGLCEEGSASCSKRQKTTVKNNRVV